MNHRKSNHTCLIYTISCHKKECDQKRKFYVYDKGDYKKLVEELCLINWEEKIQCITNIYQWKLWTLCENIRKVLTVMCSKPLRRNTEPGKEVCGDPVGWKISRVCSSEEQGYQIDKTGPERLWKDHCQGSQGKPKEILEVCEIENESQQLSSSLSELYPVLDPGINDRRWHYSTHEHQQPSQQ